MESETTYKKNSPRYAQLTKAQLHRSLPPITTISLSLSGSSRLARRDIVGRVRFPDMLVIQTRAWFSARMFTPSPFSIRASEACPRSGDKRQRQWEHAVDTISRHLAIARDIKSCTRANKSQQPTICGAQHASLKDSQDKGVNEVTNSEQRGESHGERNVEDVQANSGVSHLHCVTTDWNLFKCMSEVAQGELFSKSFTPPENRIDMQEINSERNTLIHTLLQFMDEQKLQNYPKTKFYRPEFAQMLYQPVSETWLQNKASLTLSGTETPYLLPACSMTSTSGRWRVAAFGFESLSATVSKYLPFDSYEGNRKERSQDMSHSDLKVVVVSLAYLPGVIWIADDRLWISVLVRLCNKMIALITANAYVSTLGGGHFLCKHVDQARHLAELQAKVAFQLGDPILFGKCHINVGYSHLLVGNFRTAKRIFIRERRFSRLLGSSLLEAVANAALIYLQKTWEFHCHTEGKISRTKAKAAEHHSAQTPSDIKIESSSSQRSERRSLDSDIASQLLVVIQPESPAAAAGAFADNYYRQRIEKRQWSGNLSAALGQIPSIAT